jgi:hypothetical protein
VDRTQRTVDRTLRTLGPLDPWTFVVESVSLFNAVR